jgi:hypothetical protein
VLAAFYRDRGRKIGGGDGRSLAFDIFLLNLNLFSDRCVGCELRRIMHHPIAKTGDWVNKMLKGHLNYFGLSRSAPSTGAGG